MFVRRCLGTLSYRFLRALPYEGAGTVLALLISTACRPSLPIARTAPCSAACTSPTPRGFPSCRATPASPSTRAACASKAGPQQPRSDTAIASPRRSCVTPPETLSRRVGKTRSHSWRNASPPCRPRTARTRLAVLGGGSLTNEKAYLVGKFARVALRTANVDYNGRFCMSSAAGAMQRALGLDRGLALPPRGHRPHKGAPARRRKPGRDDAAAHAVFPGPAGSGRAPRRRRSAADGDSGLGGAPPRHPAGVGSRPLQRPAARAHPGRADRRPRSSARAPKASMRYAASPRRTGPSASKDSPASRNATSWKRHTCSAAPRAR